MRSIRWAVIGFFLLSSGITPGASAGDADSSKARADALRKVTEELALEGAKLQAEQMRAIAWWNWEMRRALKEFLYLQQVRGLAPSLPCFPNDETGARLPFCKKVPGDRRFDFAFYDPREESAEEGANFFPSTCVIFEATNNYCQKARRGGQPEMRAQPFSLGDPISLPPGDQHIYKLIADCSGRSDINERFLRSWLFGLGEESGGWNEDPFQNAYGFSRIGYLPRAAAIRARIESLERLIQLPRESEVSFRLKTRLGIRPAKIEEITAPVSVASTVFIPSGGLDRGDCHVYRQLRTIQHFPFGVRATQLPRYELTVRAWVLGKEYTATASAEVSELSLGPDPEREGGEKKMFVASAVGHADQSARDAGPGFPNPLVTARERDASAGGFSRSSHLGYLNEARLALGNEGQGLHLAGMISPWEEARYLAGCSSAARPEILYEPSFLEDGPRALLRLQERVASYLGDSEAKLPFVKAVMPAERLERFWDRVKTNGWLDLKRVPDPYRRDDSGLRAYATAHGAAFTAAPSLKEKQCPAKVRLLDSEASVSSAPPPLPPQENLP